MSRERNTNHKRERLHKFVDMFGCRVKLAHVIVSARSAMPVHWWRCSGAVEYASGHTRSGASVEWPKLLRTEQFANALAQAMADATVWTSTGLCGRCDARWWC